MRQLIIILIAFTLFECRQNTHDKLLRGLNSCDVDSICVSSYYFGEQQDKSVIRELLTGINDMRVSHHIQHKGMSVYYCKVTALNKITGLDIKVKQTDYPDSITVQKFITWAFDNKQLDDIETINLQSCVGR